MPIGHRTACLSTSPGPAQFNTHVFLFLFFSQLLFICLVLFPTSHLSPAIHRKGDSASFAKVAGAIILPHKLYQRGFYSWNLVNVCFLHCLFKVTEYCNFFALISIIPTCVLYEQWKGIMRHAVYSDAFGGNVHLMKK